MTRTNQKYYNKNQVDDIVSKAVAAALAAVQPDEPDDSAMDLDNCKKEDSPVQSIQPLTMTIRELADSLQVSLPTAYALARTEGFPLVCIGKRLLINRAKVQDWLDSHCA